MIQKPCTATNKNEGRNYDRGTEAMHKRAERLDANGKHTAAPKSPNTGQNPARKTMVRMHYEKVDEG